MKRGRNSSPQPSTSKVLSREMAQLKGSAATKKKPVSKNPVDPVDSYNLPDYTSDFSPVDSDGDKDNKAVGPPSQTVLVPVSASRYPIRKRKTLPSPPPDLDSDDDEQGEKKEQKKKRPRASRVREAGQIVVLKQRATVSKKLEIMHKIGVVKMRNAGQNMYSVFYEVDATDFRLRIPKGGGDAQIKKATLEPYKYTQNDRDKFFFHFIQLMYGVAIIFDEEGNLETRPMIPYTKMLVEEGDTVFCLCYYCLLYNKMAVQGFDRSWSIQRHVRSCHPFMHQLLYECSDCSERFIHAYQLNAHRDKREINKRTNACYREDTSNLNDTMLYPIHGNTPETENQSSWEVAREPIKYPYTGFKTFTNIDSELAKDHLKQFNDLKDYVEDLMHVHRNEQGLDWANQMWISKTEYLGSDLNKRINNSLIRLPQPDPETGMTTTAYRHKAPLYQKAVEQPGFVTYYNGKKPLCNVIWEEEPEEIANEIEQWDQGGEESDANSEEDELLAVTNGDVSAIQPIDFDVFLGNKNLVPDENEGEQEEGQDEQQEIEQDEGQGEQQEIEQEEIESEGRQLVPAVEDVERIENEGKQLLPVERIGDEEEIDSEGRELVPIIRNVLEDADSVCSLIIDESQENESDGESVSESTGEKENKVGLSTDPKQSQVFLSKVKTRLQGGKLESPVQKLKKAREQVAAKKAMKVTVKKAKRGKKK